MSDLEDESYEDLTSGLSPRKRYFIDANLRRISGLRIGQCHAECFRMSHDDHSRRQIQKAAAEIAAETRSAITRTRLKYPNNVYETDSGSFRTKDYDIMIFFVVTRIA